MEEIIEKFSEIIESYQITLYKQLADKQLFEATIKFKNVSKLLITDHLIGIDKRKYSYQWMQADNSLIIRWDNAPHHPEIANFPHHKHVNSDENIIESEEMTLEKTLDFIGKMVKF